MNQKIKNQIFIAFLFFALIFSAFSKAKSPKNKIANLSESSQSGESNFATQNSEKSQNSSIIIEDKSKNKKSKKTISAELIDEITGEKYQVKETPSAENSALKISLLKSPGAFNVFAYGLVDDAETEKSANLEIPLLAKTDGGATTFFELVAGKNIYRLNRSGGVKRETRTTKNSVQIVYEIASTARVLIDFMPIEFGSDKGNSLLKVTILTTNISKRKRDFAVKCVFDTYLGEMDNHFALSSGINVNSETLLLDFSKENWFSSAGTLGNFQVLFCGEGITTPQSVSFGVRDKIIGALWQPNIVENRRFDSMLSYNNSAVAINWKKNPLEAQETSETVFFIATGFYAKSSAAKDYLDSLNPNQTNEENKSQEIPESPPAQISEPEEENEIEEEHETVNFVPLPFERNRVESIYIQELIERINSLQSDPQLVDRNEIKRLNEELDRLLLKVRRR